ncbi:MAG: hypothetical protein BJ554DRAFT_1782, partial [Olpidium bornovanus]
ETASSQQWNAVRNSKWPPGSTLVGGGICPHTTHGTEPPEEHHGTRQTANMAPKVQNTMKPIVNMHRKRIIRTVASACTFGFVSAEAYWHMYVIPKYKKIDAFYEKIEKEKAEGTYKT